MLCQATKHTIYRTMIALLVLWCALYPSKTFAKEEETLPENRAGSYSFYLGEQTPYVRLSPHRCKTVDLNGDVVDRRICALYALADLRRFGGQDWSAEEGYHAAYSFSPRATVRSGTVYSLYSPEQAGLDETLAKRLRAIVSISYPFCSAEQMCATLVDAGALLRQGSVISAAENFSDDSMPATISESELLSAVQTAIWSLMAPSEALKQVYTETASAGRVARTLQPDMYSGNDEALNAAKNNINAVYRYLMLLEAKDLSIDAPITGMMLSAIREEAEDRVRLRISPNGTVNADDTLTLQVGADIYTLFSLQDQNLLLKADADGSYTLLLAGMKSGNTVQVRLSGTQNTARDVCLYVPKNGDVSQALVGVFEGEVQVAASASLSTDDLTQRARIRCYAPFIQGGQKLPLEDASFDLYHVGASGARVRIAEDIHTDAEGLAEIEGLHTLQTGEHYAFVQTKAPVGYALPEKNEVYADTAVTVVQENRPIAASSVRLTLSDDDGTAIPSIGFTLSYAKSAADLLDLGTYHTDAAGEIHLSNLPIGRYLFSQQAIPEGFAADTQTYEFVIGAGGGEVALSAKNYAYRSISGSVRFDGDMRPGSVMVRLLRDGVVCAEQSVSEDTDWSYRFSDLPVNAVYTIQQEALSGYSSETDALGILNRPRFTDVTLHQTGKADLSLRGTVFSVRSAVDGRHICTTASDDEGSIRLFDLSVGSYVLKERRAPSGYCEMEEDLLLVVSDPNVESDGTSALAASLQTMEGEPIEGLILYREKEPILVRFAVLWIPAMLALLTLAAVTWRSLFTAHRSKPRVYSGRTRLYPLVKSCKPFGIRIFRKQ